MSGIQLGCWTFANESKVVTQNSHKELWALLNWANPGSLSDWASFERHYVEPLKLGQKKDCSDLQLAKVLAGLVDECPDLTISCICMRWNW